MAELSPAPTIEPFTAGDGYTWRYRLYRPSGNPRAHIVCLHGIQSHGGWYEHSCRWLSERGYEVSFLDRRGAGLNQQSRGDAPSFRRLLDDVAEFLGRRQQGQGTRTMLMGISWGGKLAVALQRRHPGLVNGLALLCPGFFSQVRPTLRERFGIVVARVLQPSKQFPVPLDRPDLFTATPHWQRFIADDPLSLRQASARLLLESARLDGYLRFVPRFVRVPVLLLLAEKDRIIRNAPTRRFVERFACADREIIEYPAAHHTLEFEPEPEHWLHDLARWLERQAKPQLP